MFGNYLKVWHKNGTFSIVRFNHKVLRKAPFIQFSLKNPWLLPSHRENEQFNMWGWLIFYFGYVKA